MPLYEYKCARCGKVFEVLQKFVDEPLHQHADCGGAVERLVSAPTLQFKGSGWYVTDYGKNGSVPKDKTKAESTDTKSTEAAKPAATPAKESAGATKTD
ncbi:MAG TPA: FmdB family zinc ribbon protein [Bryobacteraceae bacterium]|nr:FmdB family zinc ribbon protein [Bryobacteraceae bacterium]